MENDDGRGASRTHESFRANTGDGTLSSPLSLFRLYHMINKEAVSVLYRIIHTIYNII